MVCEVSISGSVRHFALVGFLLRCREKLSVCVPDAHAVFLATQTYRNNIIPVRLFVLLLCCIMGVEKTFEPRGFSHRCLKEAL